MRRERHATPPLALSRHHVKSPTFYPTSIASLGGKTLEFGNILTEMFALVFFGLFLSGWIIVQYTPHHNTSHLWRGSTPLFLICIYISIEQIYSPKSSSNPKRQWSKKHLNRDRNTENAVPHFYNLLSLGSSASSVSDNCKNKHPIHNFSFFSEFSGL